MGLGQGYWVRVRVRAKVRVRARVSDRGGASDVSTVAVSVAARTAGRRVQLCKRPCPLSHTAVKPAEG